MTRITHRYRADHIYIIYRSGALRDRAAPGAGRPTLEFLRYHPDSTMPSERRREYAPLTWLVSFDYMEFKM